MAMDHRPEDLNAHRLYIGADSDFYFGPGRSLAGCRTAVDLIAETRSRLDVDERDVIAFGSSFGGLASLWVGLKARAGLIVSGAPPVRCGGWILRLDRALPPDGRAAEIRSALLALTRVDDDEARIFFDKLILRATTRAEHAADVRLFASLHDPVVDEVLWLHDRLRGHPTLRCEVEIGDYATHAEIKIPFFA